MAYPPVSIPPAGGASRPYLFLSRHRNVSTQPISQHAQAGSVLAVLREQIASGSHQVDVILNAIAVAAQNLTSGTGAAIAMGHDGVILCVGSSGDAPGLGARVSVDSGISGECLRSGQILRCDDTQFDDRVDAAVCESLGIRAIVAVPLHGAAGMVGVLEVFSCYAFSFTDAHMGVLASLAELAEKAHARVAAAVEAISLPAPAPVAAPPMAVAPVVRAPIAAPVARRTRRVLPAPKALLQRVLAEVRRRSPQELRIAGAAFAAVVLLTAVAFMAHENSTPSSQPEPEFATLQGDEVELPLPATVLDESLEAKPSPNHPAPTGRVKAAAQSTTEPDAEEVVVRNLKSTTDDASSDTEQVVAAPARIPTTTTQDDTPIEAPKVVAVNSESTSLGALLPATTTLPAAPKMVTSQGVKGGVLQYRVQPEYPVQARALRLEGKVALLATVNESGNVENVKLLQGNSLLGQAAIDAVKQWRYKPFLLNGKPVKAETNVTVDFKQP